VLQRGWVVFDLLHLQENERHCEALVIERNLLAVRVELLADLFFYAHVAFDQPFSLDNLSNNLLHVGNLLSNTLLDGFM